MRTTRTTELPPLRWNSLPEPEVIYRDETEEERDSAMAEFNRLGAWQPTQPGELA